MPSTLQSYLALFVRSIWFLSVAPQSEDKKKRQSLFPCLLSTHHVLPAIVESKKNVSVTGINNSKENRQAHGTPCCIFKEEQLCFLHCIPERCIQDNGLDTLEQRVFSQWIEL